MKRFYFIVVILLVVQLADVQAQTSKTLIQGTEDHLASRVDALFSHLNEVPSPGIALAVVREGKVILRRGYGLANIEHRIPITPSTIFDIASVSKQFTGFAVATLVSEGKIKLNDDIRKYIPEFPDLGRPITIDHLVHHTSGLRDWPGTLQVAGWRPNDPIAFEQIMRMTINQRSLNFVPGDKHLYSNTNYNVLAEMVQRVTGKSFRAWTGEHLFRPLGMNSTHVRDDFTEIIPNRAFGYSRAADGSFRHIPDLAVAFGSSSIFSSVDDISRWLINFDEAKVGGRTTIALMRSPGALNNGSPVRYAFGLLTGNIPRYNNWSLFTHSGSWASFNSYMVYFPDKKFGVIVLANSGLSVNNAQNAVINVSNIYLEKDLADDVTFKAPPPIPAVRTAELPSTILEQYAGLYRSPSSSHARVKRDGKRMTIRVTHENPQAMEIKSEREFLVQGEDDYVPVSFQLNSAGQVSALDFRGKHWVRIKEPERPSLRRLAMYAGDYDSEELGTSYRIVVKNDSLEIQHRRRFNIPLTWLWEDEFGSPDGYMASLQFEYDKNKRVSSMVVNGDPRNLNIRFLKRR